jgi:MFS family permease
MSAGLFSPYKSWGKYLALFFLFFAFTYNLLARYILIFQYSIPLAEDLTPEERAYQSIKEALGLSSKQYGLLTGPAFMAVFAFFNLFSGFVADNFNRRITLTVGLAITSCSIALMFFINEFYQLFLLRALLATGQAFYGPLAYFLNAIYFPDYKTTANAICASGVYAGYGLSSLSLLVLPEFGWKNLSLYTGIAGGVITVLFVLVIREPKRINQITKNIQSDVEDKLLETKTLEPEIKPLSWFQSVKVSLSSPHVITMIVILLPRLCGGGVLGAFFPLLMKTRFPEQKAKFAAINSLVVTAGGILSSLLGGFITDKWVAYAKEKAKLEELEQELLVENDYDGTSPSQLSDSLPKTQKPASLKPYLYIASLSCLISLPFFAAVFLSHNLYLCMGLLFCAYLLSECYFAPILTVFYTTSTLPTNVRSTALSISIGVAQFLAAWAPVIVGTIDDKYHALETQLLIGVLVPNAIAGIIAFTAACILR